VRAQHKRRHHYVWQYYLAAWTSGGTVACRRGERIFRTGTPVLGVETDLYRLMDLSPQEVEFIRQLCFSDTTHPFLRRLNAGWLPVFLGPFALRRLADSLPQKAPELEEALALAESNTEEDLYAMIEAGSVPYLDRLRSADLRFLDSDEDRGRFLHYLCVQCFRTPKLRHTLDAALAGLPEVRAEHVVGLMRHVFAPNVAWGLLQRWSRTVVTLLNAPRGVEFITSDQPVVNLHAVGTAMFEPVEELCLYYPVGPGRALVWDSEVGRHRIEEREATTAEVTKLNKDIVSLAHEQIYARSEQVLRNLTGFGSAS
jgi:hypothetical protein